MGCLGRPRPCDVTSVASRSPSIARHVSVLRLVEQDRVKRQGCSRDLARRLPSWASILTGRQTVTGESVSTASVHGVSALGRKITQERPGKAGLGGAAVCNRMVTEGTFEQGPKGVGSEPCGFLGECLAGGCVDAKAPLLQWAEFGGGRGWCGLGVGHGSEGVGGWVVWVLKAVVRPWPPSCSGMGGPRRDLVEGRHKSTIL